MKAVKFLSAVFFALVLTQLPISVQAATVSECQALIDEVQDVLDGVEIVSRNAQKDRAGLEKKLRGAKDKLEQYKAEDALMKLEDFGYKVEQLRDARKPKISAEDAAALLAALNDAVACVETLIAQSAG